MRTNNLWQVNTNIWKPRLGFKNDDDEDDEPATKPDENPPLAIPIDNFDYKPPNIICDDQTITRKYFIGKTAQWENIGLHAAYTGKQIPLVYVIDNTTLTFSRYQGNTGSGFTAAYKLPANNDIRYFSVPFYYCTEMSDAQLYLTLYTMNFSTGITGTLVKAIQYNQTSNQLTYDNMQISNNFPISIQQYRFAHCDSSGTFSTESPIVTMSEQCHCQNHFALNRAYLVPGYNKLYFRIRLIIASPTWGLRGYKTYMSANDTFTEKKPQHQLSVDCIVPDNSFGTVVNGTDGINWPAPPPPTRPVLKFNSQMITDTPTTTSGIWFKKNGGVTAVVCKYKPDPLFNTRGTGAFFHWPITFACIGDGEIRLNSNDQDPTSIHAANDTRWGPTWVSDEYKGNFWYQGKLIAEPDTEGFSARCQGATTFAFTSLLAMSRKSDILRQNTQSSTPIQDLENKSPNAGISAGNDNAYSSRWKGTPLSLGAHNNPTGVALGIIGYWYNPNTPI